MTEAEVTALRNWSPEFLQLPVHREALHAVRLGMDGIESSAMIGARGVGKTHTITTLVRMIQDEEVERSLEEPRYIPRRAEVYQASYTTGAKTALIDMYEVLCGAMSTSMKRAYSPRRLVEEIATEIQAQRIHLVCIDEAQMIDAANLDQIRQLLDYTAKEGHPFGLVLVGSEELRETLVQIQQLGQRFSSEIRFPTISTNEIAPFLPGFHPHLGPLKRSLSTTEWRQLEREFFQAVQGNFRRIRVVLQNANALAIEWRRPVDAEILRFAINKLAPEV